MNHNQPPREDSTSPATEPTGVSRKPWSAPTLQVAEINHGTLWTTTSTLNDGIAKTS